MSCCSTRSPVRRGVEAAGVLLSGATLILMPKCPVCVAAWVALATGVSLSAAVASQLRLAVLIACVAVLLIFVGKRLLQRN